MQLAKLLKTVFTDTFVLVTFGFIIPVFFYIGLMVAVMVLNVPETADWPGKVINIASGPIALTLAAVGLTGTITSIIQAYRERLHAERLILIFVTLTVAGLVTKQIPQILGVLFVN